MSKNLSFALKVSVARPANGLINGVNLYVSGFPKTVTEPELESVFRPFGSIIDVHILFDKQTSNFWF